MKRISCALLLLIFGLAVCGQVFGFCHDGVRPLGYTNIVMPWTCGCGGYTPPTYAHYPCGAANIWAEDATRHPGSPVGWNGGYHRCYGQAPCQNCGEGVVGSEGSYGVSAIAVGGAVDADDSTDTIGGVVTGTLNVNSPELNETEQATIPTPAISNKAPARRISPAAAPTIAPKIEDKSTAPAVNVKSDDTESETDKIN